MRARVDAIASAAARCGVRLMIDAEQTYFQPAIDSIVTDLQARHNAENPTAPSDASAKPPVIFGTYQCYLADSRARLEGDLERARRGGYRLAAKLVRGAYMVGERQRAASLRLAAPTTTRPARASCPSTAATTLTPSTTRRPP